MMKTFLSIIILSLYSFSAQSAYPGMKYSWICNGYTIKTGHVSKVVATTQSDGGEAVYMELSDASGKVIEGGRIYPRDPVAYGYTPLERSAYIALITGVEVTGCFNSGSPYSDVYSLELHR
ncbi:hypothetical protein ACQPT2_21030 [Erwinia amylovora]